MIDTSIRHIQLKDLSEGHLFKHGAYVWRKASLNGQSGGVRTSKTNSHWLAIRETMNVLPLVIGVFKNETK